MMVLGRFAFHQSPIPVQPPPKVETPKPSTQREPPAIEPSAESTNNAIATETDSSTVTNAADLYRQAFALYDALTDDEKGILQYWGTNVDASVEAALCEKIRPICDLMHRAGAANNCVWTEDISLQTVLRARLPALTISPTAIWSAAHCRSRDPAGATDDLIGLLELGLDIAPSAMTSSFDDIRFQHNVTSYIQENLGLFHGGDAQRLIIALQDSAYDDAPIRALRAEAEMEDRQASELIIKSANEANVDGEPGASVLADRSVNITQHQQLSDLQQELADALASQSDDSYEAWQQHATELQKTNPLVLGVVRNDESFMDSVQEAEINRALVAAGLALAQEGAGALQTHPDPSSGQPFLYTETPVGFQLQSTYQLNGKPMTMQFKSR
ncbi:MAG TPA: hypothetical protein VMP11_03500 [Verrucomicrobiae bacterium]|nr:hypothetical protein [Verrucomicrobiae bacterium]